MVRPGFCAHADKESSVFTWKGRVDRQARQARDLVLAPRAVVPPVAGLLDGDEPHRALAEEILAVDQLLDCGERERRRLRPAAGVPTLPPSLPPSGSGDSLK